MIQFNFMELDIPSLRVHKERMISSNRGLKELIGYLKKEQNSLEYEKKALKDHTEELIKILTHLQDKKLDKKKKSLVLNNPLKSQRKNNKPDSKLKGKNDKSKNLGSNINEILSDVKMPKEEEKHPQNQEEERNSPKSKEISEEERKKEDLTLEEELAQIRQQIAMKHEINNNVNKG